MSYKNSFSLNTSPAQSDHEGDSGGVDSPPIDTAIDESFWRSHLWPPHRSPSPPPPPPVNIFSRGSVTSGSATADDGSFAFPVLAVGGGCNWGVIGKEKMVAVAPVIKGADGMKGGKKEEEKGKGKKRDGHGEEDAAAVAVNGERERRKKMRIMFTNLQALLPRLSDKADKTTIVEEAIRYIKTLETSLHNLQQPKPDKLHHPTTAIAAYEPLSSTPPHLKLTGQTTRESFLAQYGSGPSSFPQGHDKANKIPTASADHLLHPGPNNDNQLHGRVMFQTWTSSNVVLNTFGENEAMIMACSRKKPGLLAAIAAVLEKHKVEVESANVFCDGHYCSLMIHAHLANIGASEQRPNPSAEGVYKEAVKELMLLVVDNTVKVCRMKQL